MAKASQNGGAVFSNLVHLYHLYYAVCHSPDSVLFWYFDYLGHSVQRHRCTDVLFSWLFVTCRLYCGIAGGSCETLASSSVWTISSSDTDSRSLAHSTKQYTGILNIIRWMLWLSIHLLRLYRTPWKNRCYSSCSSLYNVDLCMDIGSISNK